MFQRISKRRAISVVLTTMIILVASVVLGTGVVIYGTSLFQTGAQQEAISTQSVAVWVNATEPTGMAWGAAGVRNSGDKLVSVDNIQIRGQSVPFTQWFVEKNQSAVTTENYQSQYKITIMNVITGLLSDSVALSGACSGVSGTIIKIDFDGGSATQTKPTLCLVQASGPTSLNPGQQLIVYFRMPSGLLTPVDSGSATGVSIYAGKTGAPISVTVGNP